MVFLTTNLVNGLLLVVSFVLFFALKNKLLHIGSGIIIIVLLFQMEVNTLIIVLTAFVLIATSMNWLMTKNSVIGALIGLILLVPLTAVPIMADHAEGHTGTTPEGYEEAPDMIIEIRELAAVRRITHQPNLQVLGTDYLTFDNGKLMSYLTQGGFPITNADCSISVLYPNMSLFIDDVHMDSVNQSNFEGLYYLDFTVPNITGVYPVNARCFYNVTPEKDIVSSSNGSFPITGGDSFSLDFKDGFELEYSGDNTCTGLCEQIYTFDLPAGFDTQFLTDFFVQTNMRSEEGTLREYRVSIFNIDTGDYTFWFNFTKNTLQQTQEFSLNNSYVSNGTQIQVKLNATDFKNGRVLVDNIFIRRFYNGTIVSDLRGNSEVVISKKLNNATNLIITPPPQEILSGDSIINILLLVGIIVSAVSGAWIITSLLLVLWVILYSTSIYITITLLMIGLYSFYRAKIQKN